MARKKKREVFRASKAVKAAAREHIGSPQPTQVADNRKKQKKLEKHKPTTARLLSELNDA